MVELTIDNFMFGKRFYLIFFLVFLCFYNMGCATEEIKKSFTLQLDTDAGEAKIEKESLHNDKNYTKIIKDILPASVVIKALKTDSYVEENGENNYFLYKEQNNVFSIGSGFIIDKNGTILTNNHVIENADKIIVTTFDNQELIADVVGRDKISDLALLRLRARRIFSFIKLNKDIEYSVGENVVVIGNPYNLGLSVSTGIISAVDRVLQFNDDLFYTNLIQTDASINVGNSGGPVFKENGELLGITSAIFSPSGTSIGLGFAIPTDKIVEIVEKIDKFGYVQRGWIGIKGADIWDEELRVINSNRRNGVIITDIEVNSPADKAKLRISDVVVSFNEKSVDNLINLLTAISNIDVGTSVNVVVLRNGEYKKITVMVEEYKDSSEKENTMEYVRRNSKRMFGSNVILIDKNTNEILKLSNNKSGLYILSIAENSELNRHDIKQGDIIVSINQNQINNTNDLNKALIDLKTSKGKDVLLIIKKQNNSPKVIKVKNPFI